MSVGWILQNSLSQLYTNPIWSNTDGPLLAQLQLFVYDNFSWKFACNPAVNRFPSPFLSLRMQRVTSALPLYHLRRICAFSQRLETLEIKFRVRFFVYVCRVICNSCEGESHSSKYDFEMLVWSYEIIRIV